MRSRLVTVLTLSLLGLPAARQAAADTLRTWEGLGDQSARPGGLFAQWGADQRKVADALRALEHASQSRTLSLLEARVADKPDDLAARDLLGRACQRAGLVSRAIAQFQAVIRADPAFSSSRLALADLYIEADRLGLAAEQLNELIRLRPEAREARRRLGLLQLRMGRYREAADVLGELVSMDPRNRDDRIELARALVWDRQRATAEAILDALVRQSPEDAIPYLLRALGHRLSGEWAEARRELEGLVREHPSPEASFQLALVLLHEEKSREAYGLLAPLLARAPRDLRLLAATAIAAQTSGEVDDALTRCSQMRSAGSLQLAARLLANVWLARGDAAAARAALDALPGAAPGSGAAYAQMVVDSEARPEIRKRLGALLSLELLFGNIGWESQALEALEEAKKLAPNSPMVEDLLAVRYAALGRHDEALAVRERLAKAHPDSAPAALALARVCARAGQLDRARSIAEGVRQRAPDLREALLILAHLAFRQSDFAAAAELCQAALAKDPLNESAFRLLLDAQVATGDFKGARVAILAREGAAPTFVSDAMESGLVAAGAGDMDRALRECTAGLRRSPYDGRLRLLAGLLCEDAGDQRAAAEHFDVVMLVEPDSVMAWLHRARMAMALGQAMAALKLYAQASAMAPERIAVQLECAAVLSRLGSPRKAVALLLTLKPKAKGERLDVQAALAREYLLIGMVQEGLGLAEAVLIEQPSHQEARRLAVEAYRRLGDVDAAAKLCERVAGAAPEVDLDAELGLLRVLQGSEGFRDASDRLGRAIRQVQGRTLSDLAMWLAAARLGLGDMVGARVEADECLAYRPDDAPGSPPLAAILAAAGMQEQADRETARIGKAEPELAAWMKAAMPRFAQRPRLASLFAAGHLALVLQWDPAAVSLFQAARADAPDEPAVLYALAIANLHAGRHGAGLKAAQDLGAKCPASGRAQLLVAHFLDLERQPEAALQACKLAAARMDKKDLQGWQDLGRRFAAAGAAAPAIEAYQNALALDPDYALAANNLAWLYASNEPGKLAEALRLATRAAALQPKSAAYHDTLGWVLFLCKKHGEAERELETTLALAPATGTYLYHLGMICFALGKRDDARDHLERALEMDPALPGADTARATLKLLAPAPQEKPGPKGTPGKP